MAQVKAGAGQFDQADELFERAFNVQIENGNRDRAAQALLAWAESFVKRGNGIRYEELLRKALTLHDEALLEYERSAEYPEPSMAFVILEPKIVILQRLEAHLGFSGDMQAQRAVAEETHRLRSRLRSLKNEMSVRVSRMEGDPAAAVVVRSIPGFGEDTIFTVEFFSSGVGKVRVQQSGKQETYTELTVSGELRIMLEQVLEFERTTGFETRYDSDIDDIGGARIRVLKKWVEYNYRITPGASAADMCLAEFLSQIQKAIRN
ncbi:MAG: tetratricopeptide repeat protein [Leptospirales bacterium]|nr:tetratricopeptide repeat protein [Leptospirales bacterium]